MLYDFLLFLGSLYAIPKWLIQKKYRGTVLARLGIRLPPPSPKKSLIWIHMVSMGETKIMARIYQSLKQKYPDTAFYLSTASATGQAEAKRSLPYADCYFFLPLDQSWVMNRLIKRLKPRLLILSESDFWYNQIRLVKKHGGKVLLLNGKISERSANRFSKLPRFAKKLFGSIDHLCIQSKEYADLFTALQVDPSKITITGNLKLAIPTKKITPEEKSIWQKRLGVDPNEPVITIGSTHENEELLILKNLFTSAKILLVPRHPERFAKVKKLVQELNNPQIIVVDQMGVLTTCYQLSTVAILGGSFLPGVGGHNIFEPIQANIPVIFGPYMETQKELVQLILGANAGIQTPAENLKSALSQIGALAQNAHKLSSEGEQVFQRTWEQLELNHTV